jgi:hypothetical protein
MCSSKVDGDRFESAERALVLAAFGSDANVASFLLENSFEVQNGNSGCRLTLEE